MFKARFFAISAVWLLAPMAAGASTLYRCTDESGHATYTNYKPGNRKCSILSRDIPSSTPANGAAKTASSSARKPSPADFPKVASETQSSRDNDRRYILEQELAAEQKHLGEARQQLAEQINAQSSIPQADRTQPLRDRIALHTRNMDALRREIANLKQ